MRTTKRRPPARPSSKHIAEAALLTKLQKRHGYMLTRHPQRSKRLTAVIDFKTRQTSAAYVLQVIVPTDSALGEVMLAADERDRKAKAKRRVRP